MIRKVRSFLFRNQNAGQTAAKNAVWLSISNFGGRLLRAAIVIYAARVLGPAEWGVFNYAITMVALLTLFVDLGLNQVMIREGARRATESERLRVVSTVFVLKLGLTILGLLFVVLIGPYLPIGDSATRLQAMSIFPIVAFVLAFDVLRVFASAVFQFSEKMEREAAVFLLTNAAIVVFGYVALWITPTLAAFSISYALGTCVGMVTALWILRAVLARTGRYFTPGLIGELLRSAWPLAVSGLLATLMINTDVFMIGWLLKAEDLGYYSVPQRLLQILYLGPAILAQSIMPYMSRLANRDNDRLRAVLERVLSTSLFAAIPLAIGGIVVAPKLIDLLFGSQYLAAALPLRILLVTLLFDFPATILSAAIFTLNRQRILIIYSGLGSTLNIFMNFLLIPSFGIAGCAIATLVAQTASMTYLWRSFRQLIPARILPKLANAAAGTIMMVIGMLALSGLGLHVILTIVFAGTLYAVFLVARRESLFREVRRIWQTSK